MVVKNILKDGGDAAEGFSFLEEPEGRVQAKLHHHIMITTKLSHDFSTHFHNQRRTLSTVSAQERYGADTSHISRQ